MSSTSINDIKTWVTKLQEEIREEEGESIVIDRLEVWHAVEGEGGERLLVLKSITGQDADDIAASIWASAENDANARPNATPQRYVVLGFDPAAYAENPESAQPEDRIAFVVKGKTNSLMFGDTDSPTEKGALGHSMRMTNNIHQMMMGMVEATTGRVVRQLEQETRRREKAEKVGMELYDALQTAKDNSVEREIHRAAELARVKRSEELMSMCVTLAPMLLTGLMTKVIPREAQEIARDKGIQKLLKTLNQEQVAAILETLQPEQRIAMIQLYAQYREEEQKEQDKLPGILKDSNGEDDGKKEEAQEVH